MPLALFFAFIVGPVIEIYVYVLAGQAFGAWTVLGLILLAVMAGVSVMRRAFRSWRRQAASLGAGGSGAGGVVAPSPAAVSQAATASGDAALVWLAGLLLFLPGLISDAVGLLLLIPPVRRLVRRRVGRAFTDRVAVVRGRFGVWGAGGPFVEGEVIRGEVIREDGPPPNRGPGERGQLPPGRGGRE
jgi:UPF0716 protein FxsA